MTPLGWLLLGVACAWLFAFWLGYYIGCQDERSRGREKRRQLVQWFTNRDYVDRTGW